MPVQHALASLCAMMACVVVVIGGGGCKDPTPQPTPLPATQPKPLADVLRDAVARAPEYASDKDTAMILRVAARALGRDGTEHPAGTLAVESTEPIAPGQRKIVASWRRETTFKLEPRQGDRQAVSWEVGDASVGTSMDLAGLPPELADVSARLRGAKDLVLSPKDPLQQVLTLSGFPDRITVSAKPKDEYAAVVETAKAEFIVDDSKLIRARVLK